MKAIAPAACVAVLLVALVARQVCAAMSAPTNPTTIANNSNSTLFASMLGVVRSNNQSLSSAPSTDIPVSISFCNEDGEDCQGRKAVSIVWGELNNFCDTMDLWTKGGWNAGVNTTTLRVEAKEDWITGGNQYGGHIGVEIFPNAYCTGAPVNWDKEWRGQECRGW